MKKCRSPGHAVGRGKPASTPRSQERQAPVTQRSLGVGFDGSKRSCGDSQRSDKLAAPAMAPSGGSARSRALQTICTAARDSEGLALPGRPGHTEQSPP